MQSVGYGSGCCAVELPWLKLPVKKHPGRRNSLCLVWASLGHRSHSFPCGSSIPYKKAPSTGLIRLDRMFWNCYELINFT